MNRFLQHLARRPLLISGTIIFLTALFIWSLGQNAALETDLDEYMPASHPAFLFSDEAEELFGIEDAVLIALEHPVSIYNPQSLEKIARISEELEEQFEEIEPGALRSLYTAENITSGDWGLEVMPFYPGSAMDEDSAEEIRRAVEGNDMVNGRMVSRDGKAAMIIAEIGDEDFNADFYDRLLAFAREQEGPEIVHVAGRPVVEGELGKLGPKDMTRMAPLVLIVMTILLFFLLRSVRDTVINLVIVLFGTITAFGLKTLLGIPIYSVDTMIPVMLIAIGVAYGIHMHNTIHHLAAEYPGASREELVRRTLKAMVRPVSMAALTTAVGFLSLVSSQVLPVRYFGIFAAIGVLTQMVLALILFPASVYILGPVQKGRETANEIEEEIDTTALQQGRGRWILDHPRTIFLIALAVTAGAVIGTGRVWIDTSFLANFQKESDIVRTDTFVNDHFGGTSTFHLILSSEEAETFKDPEVLSLMDRVQREVEQDPLAGSSFSLADYLKRMHRVMHEDDPAYEAIPENRELVAQYLLLYEMSGDPENLNQVVDYDYRQSNVTFQLKSDSSSVMNRVIETIETYSRDFQELGITIRYAGSGYKAKVFAELLLKGQILSLAISFGVVFILLALMFKSVLIGVAGTIPITITALVNFGTMGLLGIPLSSATALISSIAIGIGVDYAIHLIEHYRTMRKAGLESRAAALETLSHTGRAIIFNALAVMGGFIVLLVSVFPPNRQVGGLIALNMATSAIGTLTVLLLVIIAIDKKGNRSISA